MNLSTSCNAAFETESTNPDSGGCDCVDVVDGAKAFVSVDGGSGGVSIGGGMGVGGCWEIVGDTDALYATAGKR